MSVYRRSALSGALWHSCMVWVKVQGGYTTLTAKPNNSCLTITTGKRNVYASFHTHGVRTEAHRGVGF